MKYFSCLWGILPLLFLLGCGQPSQSANQRGVELRAGYLSAQTITAQCDLTADYGARVYDFSFDVSYTAEMTTLVITQPELLQGLSVEVGEEGSTILCDGMLMETGELSWDGLTPVTAIPVLLDQLQTGYVQRCSVEEGVVTLYCGDPDTPMGSGQEFIFTLDDATGDLLTGEILVDGVRKINCTIETIHWENESK